jgi:hypothetical protein
LSKNKAEINKAFRHPLVWENSDNKKVSIIKYYLNAKSGLQDKDKWPELQDQMIEAMIELEKAFRPFIQQLD